VAVATAIILFVVVSIATSGAINDGGGLEQAQAQTGTTTSNAITIIGTTSGEIIKIDEDKVDPEICTFAATAAFLNCKRGFEEIGSINSHA
jgi:hypothetical protein